MKRIDYTFMLTLGASIGACPVLASRMYQNLILSLYYWMMSDIPISDVMVRK